MSPRPTHGWAATLGLLSALLLSGCKADDLNILVLSARAPGDTCTFSDDTLYVSRGALDMTPYCTDPTAACATTTANTRYYQVFSWESQLGSVPLSVNGQTLDPGGGNTFIADTAVYSYQYSDPSVTLADETANMRAVITAGATAAQNSVPADLIQPKAADAIEKSTGINGTAQTLLVTFQYFGRLAAGGSKYTNKVSFPLTIYRSSTTPLNCSTAVPAGQIVYQGPCKAPGRDLPVHCAASTP
jgi:hypothetical protein